MFRVSRPILLTIALSATAIAQNSTAPAADPPEPVSIGIVVDDSAAARSEASVREAIKNVVSHLRDGDEYAVVAATDKVVLAQELTDDPALATKAIDKVHGSRRNLIFDGLVSAIDYLNQNAGNDRQALLVLSSGVDNGSRTPLDEALAKAVDASMPIYTVAVASGSWKGNADLQRLASATGGTAFFPAKRSEIDDVSQAIAVKLTGAGTRSHDSSKPLDAYSELLVRSIPVAGQIDTFPRGDNHLLQKLLVSRLQAKKIFPSVVDATSASGIEAGDPPRRPGAVELLGTIVSYREGSRLKRGTAGLLGRGATRLRVQFIFRDAATGKDLFALTEEGTGASGLLAGDNDANKIQAMNKLIDRLLRDIRQKQ